MSPIRLRTYILGVKYILEVLISVQRAIHNSNKVRFLEFLNHRGWLILLVLLVREIGG